jgi:MoaA/NifB/PqqE/SkfB family radical SAM enzyme
MTMTDKIKKSAAMAAYDYMARDPEKNIPSMLDKLIELDSEGLGLRRQVESIRDTFTDPKSSTRQEVMSFFHEVDDHQRRKLYETIVVNGSLIGTPIQKRNRAKYGCNIPWTMLIDPTSACNLKCTGCWAAEYGHTLSLTLDELESIIQQANDLGCYEFLFAGGEPMMRREDIITLCRRHQDCGFMMFTNGTLIDESFADELLEVGNLVPAISVEGYEKETDFRRGQGTFQRVMKAMEIMKRRKLIFGASCCYTRKNVELIGSDEYFDAVVSWGAKFMWCFSYTPIGKGADTSLMVTPEQRKYMYYNIRRLRSTKPLFAMDFYNDAKYVHGCIAGGRSYLHINANGDIEPCAFVHFSDANIRTDTLLGALKKPLFMAYHDNQPFNDNMLRPCPLVDNPGRLTLMVNQTGARSTEIIEPDNAEELTARCVNFAKGWAPIAAELWNKEQSDQSGTGKSD